MNNLLDVTQEFLRDAGWGDAVYEAIPADFSSRRFARLTNAAGQTAILMQAAPDQKTPQFVALAGLLRGLDVSAPEIYAAQAAHGLVLMEDFGNSNFGKWLEAGGDKPALYRRAAELLAHLHQSFKPELAVGLNLPLFSAALFVDQAELFLDSYFPKIQGRAARNEERAAFRDAWLRILQPLETLPQTLLLRDFMPDNLMDLPGRAAWRGVGVLDFQDAGIGPVAYDLASLCEAVRRDGGPEMLEPVLLYYLDLHPILPLSELRRACHILAAQRHMRVLGIVTRLAENPARQDKGAYAPRLRKTLQALLADAALQPLVLCLNSLSPGHDLI